jgi:DNA polymerase III subunit epsilon
LGSHSKIAISRATKEKDKTINVSDKSEDITSSFDATSINTINPTTEVDTMSQENLLHKNNTNSFTDSNESTQKQHLSIQIECQFVSSKTKVGSASLNNNDHFSIYQKATFAPDDYVVIDFETTGLRPEDDAIIQVAAVRFKNHEPVEQFVSFVNPQRPIPAKITNITGITNEDVKNAPTIAEIFPQFIDFLQDDVLVAHNAPFDMKFLLSNMRRLGMKKIQNLVIDTLPLARKYITETPNHQLETLKKWLKLDLNSHNALDDCLACAAVYQKCKSIREQRLKLSEEEKAAYDIIIGILNDHHRDTNIVRYSRTSTYLDIQAFYSFARIKLSGKKRYFLSKRTEKEIMQLCPNALCEPASKSESGQTRIMIQTPNDLLLIAPLIVEAFDEAVKSMEYYRTYVGKGEKVIEDYLSL